MLPDPCGDGAPLADLLPGLGLVDRLSSTPLAQVDDFDLVETVAAWRRVAAWAAARAAEAAAALARRECMNPEWPEAAGTVSEPCVAGAELALRLGWSRRAGRELVRLGAAFEGALWPTGEALERGEIDEAKAKVIARGLAAAPLPVAVGVQEVVLSRASRRTPSEIARDVQRALVEVDPLEAEQRHRRAFADRRVSRPRSLPDGMAAVWAALPAPAAHALSRGLDVVAHEARGAGDSRSMEQLRADALCAAVLGEALPRPAEAVREACVDLTGLPTGDAGVLPPTPGAGPDPTAAPFGDPAASDANPPTAASNEEPAGRADPPVPDLWELLRRRIGIDVRVLVPLDTLIDGSGAAGVVDGQAVVAPSTARALAAGGTWRRLVTDPLSGTVLDVGRTRYRPPLSLAEHVRLRDGTCVRPGCGVAAERCDLDHTVPFRQESGDGDGFPAPSADPSGGDRADAGGARTAAPVTTGASGGATAADNLGPLCRADHLIKTHGGFGLRQLGPGVFEWVTPTGHVYERDVEQWAQPLGESPWADALAEAVAGVESCLPADGTGATGRGRARTEVSAPRGPSSAQGDGAGADRHADRSGAGTGPSWRADAGADADTDGGADTDAPGAERTLGRVPPLPRRGRTVGAAPGDDGVPPF